MWEAKFGVAGLPAVAFLTLAALKLAGAEDDAHAWRAYQLVQVQPIARDPDEVIGVLRDAVEATR